MCIYKILITKILITLCLHVPIMHAAQTAITRQQHDTPRELAVVCIHKRVSPRAQSYYATLSDGSTVSAMQFLTGILTGIVCCDRKGEDFKAQLPDRCYELLETIYQSQQNLNIKKNPQEFLPED